MKTMKWKEFLQEVTSIDSDLSNPERKYPIYIESKSGKLRPVAHIDWEADENGDVRFKIVS